MKQQVLWLLLQLWLLLCGCWACAGRTQWVLPQWQCGCCGCCCCLPDKCGIYEWAEHPDDAAERLRQEQHGRELLALAAALLLLM